MSFIDENILTAENPFHIEYSFSSNRPNNNKLHKHNFIELIYITGGELKVYADYKHYLLKSGDVIFINSGIAHSIIFEKSNNAVFFQICFLPEIIYDYDNDFFNINFFFWLKSPVHKSVYLLNIEAEPKQARLFSDAYNIYTDKRYALDYSILSKIMQICIYFFKKTSLEANSIFPRSFNFNPIIVKKILNKIEKTYSSVSAFDIAATYKLSANTISKYFSEALGCSFSKYLELYRIKQAMFMLATLPLKITETAYAVGFSDSAYFSKLFRKYTGFTPSAFKKQLRGSTLPEICLRPIKTDYIKDTTHNNRLFFNTILLASYYNPEKDISGWVSNDFFDIIYTDFGNISIEFENGYINMSTGDIIVIPPFEKHRIKFSVTDEAQALRIQFFPSILNIGAARNIFPDALRNHLFVKDNLSAILCKNDDNILDSLLTLYNERYKFEAVSESIMRAHILNILAYILKKQASSSSEADNKTLIKLKEIINYIDTHYKERLSLKTIADQYYISYSHLSREFKKVTHTSFNSYVNNKRLFNSRFLLALTEYSIDEIASSMSFCSSSRFIEMFTKKFKISPLNFRKRFRTNNPLREEYKNFY